MRHAQNSNFHADNVDLDTEGSRAGSAIADFEGRTRGPKATCNKSLPKQLDLPRCSAQRTTVPGELHGASFPGHSGTLARMPPICSEPTDAQFISEEQCLSLSLYICIDAIHVCNLYLCLFHAICIYIYTQHIYIHALVTIYVQFFLCIYLPFLSSFMYLYVCVIINPCIIFVKTDYCVTQKNQHYC